MGNSHMALLENILLALGITQLFPVALPCLARGQPSAARVGVQHVKLVSAVSAVSAAAEGYAAGRRCLDAAGLCTVAGAAGALAEEGYVFEQRA